MKFPDLVKSAVANTFRSKLRTTLTVVAIFIGAFTLTITSAIGAGVSSYINGQVASIGAANILTITKTPPVTTQTGDGPAAYDPAAANVAARSLRGPGGDGGTVPALAKADLTSIAATPGLTDVFPLVQVSPDYIEHGNSGKFKVTISEQAALTKADLAAGTQLSNSSQNEVLLPDTYLSSLGFTQAKDAVGQTVTLAITDYLGTQHQVSAAVVGVQNKTLIGGGVGLNQKMTNTLSSLASSGKPAKIVTTYSTATAHISANATTAQINTIKKDLTKEGFTAKTVADQIGNFETVIGGIIGILNAFAVIALIAAGFGIINTLLMSVQERTREIGLMKAMGMKGSKVYALFSMEAVFIGFLGSAIGAAVAIALGSLVSHVLANTVLSGLPGLHVMLFTPASIAVIILVVMAIAFLAGTLPARRAARQNPIDALRYE